MQNIIKNNQQGKIRSTVLRAENLPIGQADLVWRFMMNFVSELKAINVRPIILMKWLMTGPWCCLFQARNIKTGELAAVKIIKLEPGKCARPPNSVFLITSSLLLQILCGFISILVGRQDI